MKSRYFLLTLTLILIFSLSAQSQTAALPAKPACDRWSKTDLITQAHSLLSRFSALARLDTTVAFEVTTEEKRAEFDAYDAQISFKAASQQMSMQRRYPWFKTAREEMDRLLENPALKTIREPGLMKVTVSAKDCEAGVCTSPYLLVSMNPGFGARMSRVLGPRFHEYMGFVMGHEIGHIVLNQVTYQELPEKNLHAFIDAENKQDFDWVEMIADSISVILNGISLESAADIMALDSGGRDGDLKLRVQCYKR